MGRNGATGRSNVECNHFLVVSVINWPLTDAQYITSPSHFIYQMHNTCLSYGRQKLQWLKCIVLPHNLLTLMHNLMANTVYIDKGLGMHPYFLCSISSLVCKWSLDDWIIRNFTQSFIREYLYIKQQTLQYFNVVNFLLTKLYLAFLLFSFYSCTVTNCLTPLENNFPSHNIPKTGLV